MRGEMEGFSFRGVAEAKSVGGSLRLLRLLMGISVRGQMQYRASFVLWTVGQFFVVGTEFVGLWALFARFGSLPGWTLPQVALLYGMVNIAFALAEAFGRGFDQFGGIVKTGEFDRFLLRPRSTALLLAGQVFEMSRLGRSLAGLLALLWGCANAGVDWTFAKALLVIVSTLGGACTFYGLLVFQATICFFTVESVEVMNALTYGGIEASQMPLTIYPKWIRSLFTFVVPLAGMNYIPADVLLDRAMFSPALAWISPLAGVAFLAVALRTFRIGERHYVSTGS